MHAYEHLCQVVRDEPSLLAALGQFLTGLTHHQGLFVHRYSDQEAWRLLEQAGPARALAAEGRLSVAGREPAFQGGAPRIHHDHVAQTVESARQAARRKGLGLSILADASHAYISEGRAQEWFSFENWLGRRLAQEVSLVCIYWESDLRTPGHLDGMMRTHLARFEAEPAVEQPAP